MTVITKVHQRMKGVFLGLVLMAVIPQAAQSQVLIGILLGDKVTTENFHLGVDVGLGLSNISGISGTNLKSGFHFGLLAEWRFAKGFYFQPGLLPFYQVGAKDLPFKDFGLPPVDVVVTDKSAVRQLNYYAIPIIVKYGLLQEKLHLGLGPQVNILSSAKDVFDGTISNDISVTEDIKDQLNSTDTGIAFHAEYKLRGRYGVSVTARFYLGMSDLIKDNRGEAAKNRVFSLMATIPIGGDPTKKDDEAEEPKADAGEGS